MYKGFWAGFGVQGSGFREGIRGYIDILKVRDRQRLFPSPHFEDLIRRVQGPK